MHVDAKAHVLYKLNRDRNITAGSVICKNLLVGQDLRERPGPMLECQNHFLSSQMSLLIKMNGHLMKAVCLSSRPESQ